MSSPVTTSPFGNANEIMQDLQINNSISNKEDSIITTLLLRYRMVLQNMLKPYADVLPIALANITEDLNQACNLLVEANWHRSKTHYDDYKAAMEQFKVVWDSITTFLKALPTARTKPVIATGDLASGTILMKNIPFLTDSNGQLLTGF